jgi:hypothetical protein
MGDHSSNTARKLSASRNSQWMSYAGVKISKVAKKFSSIELRNTMSFRVQCTSAAAQSSYSI